MKSKLISSLINSLNIRKTEKKELQKKLYLSEWSEPEVSATLFIEEDPHLSCVEHQCYTISNRVSMQSENLPMPLFSLNLMDAFLSNYIVFSHVFDSPVDEQILNELASYRLTPHLFCVSYARYYFANKLENEVLFFDGTYKLISITKGLNQSLIRALLSTPGFEQTIQYLIDAVQAPVDIQKFKSYQDAEAFSQAAPDIWIKYAELDKSLHVGISPRHINEVQFVQKLIDIANTFNRTLEVLWPL